MKLLFIACAKCGARHTSPFGLCPDCEAQQTSDRAVAARRQVREQVKRRPAA